MRGDQTTAFVNSTRGLGRPFLVYYLSPDLCIWSVEYPLETNHHLSLFASLTRPYHTRAIWWGTKAHTCRELAQSSPKGSRGREGSGRTERVADSGHTAPAPDTPEGRAGLPERLQPSAPKWKQAAAALSPASTPCPKVAVVVTPFLTRFRSRGNRSFVGGKGRDEAYTRRERDNTTIVQQYKASTINSLSHFMIQIKRKGPRKDLLKRAQQIAYQTSSKMRYLELALPSQVKQFHPSNASALHFNARSVRNKVDEIDLFLHQFSFKLYFTMVSERWCQNDVGLPTISGYQPFSVNRTSKRGGGVALYAINCRHCELVPEFRSLMRDYKIITIKTGNEVISTVYRPQLETLKRF